MAIRNAEFVYSGRDNTVDLYLTEDGINIPDYTPIARVVMTVGAIVIDSDVDGSVFDWSGDRLISRLGFSNIPAGAYRAKLETYDAGNPNGIVWTEDLKIIVR